MSDRSPCYNCTERTVDCHTKCERHKLWKENHEEERERRYKEREPIRYCFERAQKVRNKAINKWRRK